jgi:toxin-antitoxin system PIN domain toxin
MVIIDTNVLVHCSNRSSGQHEVCRGYIDTLRSGITAWFLTWNVLYEFVRIVTHPRVLQRPWDPGPAWSFAQRLIDSPSCEVLGPTERHEQVVNAFFRQYPDTRGNLVHDARTVIHMLEHGVPAVCSYDRDFLRFGVQVIEPTV